MATFQDKKTNFFAYDIQLYISKACEIQAETDCWMYVCVLCISNDVICGGVINLRMQTRMGFNLN